MASKTPLSKTMLLSASLATLLVIAACSSINSGVAKIMSAAVPNNYSHLPQNRIRTPERQVPYPKYHPLSRHLRIKSENDGSIRNGYDITATADYGGQSRQRRRQSRRRQNSKQTNKSSIDDELETITEEKAISNNSGEFLTYWTVTGRKLITTTYSTASISSSPISNQNDDAEVVTDESSKLLMDLQELMMTSSNTSTSITSSVESSLLAEEEENNTTTVETIIHSDFISTFVNTETSTEQNDNSIYQPIRLRAIFTDDITSGFQYLSQSDRITLMESIVNPALFAWSKALRVVPVGHGRNDDDVTDNLVVDKTQLFDGKSCGPGLDSGYPSVRVPLEHMTDGISETDTVIYISVSFLDPNVDGNETKSSSSAALPFLFHSLDESVSPSSSPSIHSFEEEPPSTVDPNVDTRPTCPGTYLASATHCSTDQYDRPVAGILSLCINDVHSFFHDVEEIQRNIMAVMHEIGHILGFNALSLAQFRNPETGEPLTPRDENGDVPYAEVECTGIAPTATSEIPLPSEDIVQFQKVRSGIRVATVVTPTVRRVARNMFGCQTLLGAELQSGEGQGTYIQRDEDSANNEKFQLSPGECIGDHWQRVLFRNDLLNPVIDDVPHSLYISPLTLAYFKDSGWYDINYDRIATVSMWGRNAGCNFVQKTCITSSGVVQASNIPFFCSNLEEEAEVKEDEDVRAAKINGCDIESSRKAVCSLVEYDEDIIPPEFSYFGNAVSFPDGVFGGKDPTLDYCPVFIGYANGRCDDKDAEEYAGVKSFEVFGENNSRCVMGHVDQRRTSLCLPIACVIQDHSLRIKVDGYWKLCDYPGQVISMWWNPNDYVVCPDPARMCPSFYCPHDCLKEAGGVCDYKSGQCMCHGNLQSSGTHATNWLSRTYNEPSMVPCSGSNQLAEVNGTLGLVERVDLEQLPQYYVENSTILLDEPKVFEEKVSRMFTQLSSGEVIGLVASSMVFILLSIYVSTLFVKCYKRRVIQSSVKRARVRMSSLPDLLRSASRPPNESVGLDDSDSQSSPDRTPPGSNPQKDKMVANLLLQNRLELANITSAMTEDSDLDKKEIAPTIAVLSPTSFDQLIVSSSELPPLEEGRVLAVVENEGRVLAVVDDESQTENRYARSSVTSVTQDHSEISESISPLYQDDEEGGLRTSVRTLRLRRNII